MTKKIGVVQYGVGPVGVMVVRAAASHELLEFKGAIDIDPAKVGKDLGYLVGLDRQLGVLVSDDAQATLKDPYAAVVLHTTGSILPEVLPQLEHALRAGKRVISTCEELVFPAYRYPRLARQIDLLAKQHAAVLVSTGVNPGFAMDVLPLTLSSIIQDVKRIHVKRYQDASHRRLPFQRKIGAGMAVDEFEKKAAEGLIRHVGLTESIALIADRIGWSLSRITDDIEAIVTNEQVTTPAMSIFAGQVVGCRQIGRGWLDSQEVITLEMSMYVGAKEEFDSTVIEGNRRIEMNIPGGIQGDVATVSRVLNTIPTILRMQPGLYTVADLPVISAVASR